MGVGVCRSGLLCVYVGECVILSKCVIRNTFISNTRLKLVKDLADAKQHPQAEKRENGPKWPKMAILCL